MKVKIRANGECERKQYGILKEQ